MGENDCQRIVKRKNQKEIDMQDEYEYQNFWK